MSATKTPLNVLVAKSIAAYARDWKRGNMGPMDAEVRKYLGIDARQRIEDAVRASGNPEQAAFDAAMREFQ